jgi:hypothetical protein
VGTVDRFFNAEERTSDFRTDINLAILQYDANENSCMAVFIALSFYRAGAETGEGSFVPATSRSG